MYINKNQWLNILFSTKFENVFTNSGYYYLFFLEIKYSLKSEKNSYKDNNCTVKRKKRVFLLTFVLSIIYSSFSRFPMCVIVLVVFKSTPNRQGSMNSVCSYSRFFLKRCSNARRK